MAAPIALAAARTVAWRLRSLAALAVAPTALRRREAGRMVTEKLAAVVEAAVAAPRAAWSGRGARGVLAAAWRPFSRRLRANARRIGRRRRW